MQKISDLKTSSSL